MLQHDDMEQQVPSQTTDGLVVVAAAGIVLYNIAVLQAVIRDTHIHMMLVKAIDSMPTNCNRSKGGAA
jgi:hypothetical protein